MNPHLRVLVFLAVLTPVGAQQPNALVGIDPQRGLVTFTSGSCAALGRTPPLAIAPSGSASNVEIAWDATRHAVWVQSLDQIGAFDPTTGAALVPPMNSQWVFWSGGVAGGLAVVESRDELWAFTLLGEIKRGRLSGPHSTFPTRNQCTTGRTILANELPAGLAVDELRGLVFFAVFDRVHFTNTIYVSTMADPCSTLQQLAVGPCTTGFGAIAGLALDPASQVLTAADVTGQIQAWDYALQPGGPPLTFTSRGCCSLQGGLLGVTLRPGGATSTGTPCANGSCASCPSATSLAADPVLGNPAFGIELSGTPAASLAFCVIGAGACNPSAPTTPPLCGPLLPPIELGVLGPVVAGGSTGCSGTASMPLPLLLLPALNGQVVSAQWISLCSNGGNVGTAMSACLSFSLQGA